MDEDDRQDDSNEILAAAKHANDRRSAVAAKPSVAGERSWPLATIGLGIGSAALAAALIYANRGGKKKG